MRPVSIANAAPPDTPTAPIPPVLTLRWELKKFTASCTYDKSINIKMN